MRLKIKREHRDAIIPAYEHMGDSGMDLRSVEDYILPRGETVLVKTGLSVEVPVGYEMQIRSKSGLALNHGISVLNSPGTVDAGYRGEVKVILMNHGEKAYRVEKGLKVAQAVICSVERAEIDVVGELSDTSRGTGGFGSTGR
jgi:dUTP pyrophosphatase